MKERSMNIKNYEDLESDDLKELLIHICFNLTDLKEDAKFIDKQISIEQYRNNISNIKSTLDKAIKLVQKRTNNININTEFDWDNSTLEDRLNGANIGDKVLIELRDGTRAPVTLGGRLNKYCTYVYTYSMEDFYLYYFKDGDIRVVSIIEKAKV